MSHCTTWHVRIDLVDDGDEVVARAKLVGAPMAMTTRPQPAPHHRCPTGRHDTDDLSRWRPLNDLTPVLVDVLSMAHRSPTPSASHAAAEPPAQIPGGTA
jgi:hypothetical protein